MDISITQLLTIIFGSFLVGVFTPMVLYIFLKDNENDGYLSVQGIKRKQKLIQSALDESNRTIGEKMDKTNELLGKLIDTCDHGRY